MDGWLNASLDLYGSGYGTGGGGPWLPDPWWAAVPPPPPPDDHDYDAVYIPWWEKQVRLGLLPLPDDEAVARV